MKPGELDGAQGKLPFMLGGAPPTLTEFGRPEGGRGMVRDQEELEGPLRPWKDYLGTRRSWIGPGRTV